MARSVPGQRVFRAVFGAWTAVVLGFLYLPILVLAEPGQGLEHRVTELGVADVLLKPSDVPHLVHTVERLITAQATSAAHTESPEHAKAV